VSGLDRSSRLILAHDVVERTRNFTDDAFDDLYAAMEKIERRHRLVPQLGATEPARRGGIDNLLPESFESILTRLAALPESEQDAIFDMIVLLIDIDAPPPRQSPEQIASLRRSRQQDDEPT
jgi:hypothetical protein